MITVTREKEHARVNGASSDCLMFYCLWQSSRWPGWLEYEKLGEMEEYRRVLRVMREGDALLLCVKDSANKLAIDVATEKCRALGIDVTEVGGEA